MVIIIFSMDKISNTYISFLRGINVSGQKMINMKELKVLYEKIGFKNVTTYIQSGNVVFQSEIKDSKKISSEIEKNIFKKYKFEVPVIIRTYDELKLIRDSNPFLKEKNINIDKLYVAMLSEFPSQLYIDKLNTFDFSPDRFILSGREVYICVENGFGRTKINNNFFENKLKLTATTRNVKTISELINIALNQS